MNKISKILELVSDSEHAVEFAKRQLPRRPKAVSSGYICKTCYAQIDPRDRYCRHCGQAQEWDAIYK